MTNHDSKVYTLRRLAARWRCSPQHVRNMCEAGKLDAFKLGGKLWRIRGDSVAKVERAQAMAIALSDDEVGS